MKKIFVSVRSFVVRFVNSMKMTSNKEFAEFSSTISNKVNDLIKFTQELDARMEDVEHPSTITDGYGNDLEDYDLDDMESRIRDLESEFKDMESPEIVDSYGNSLDDYDLDRMEENARRIDDLEEKIEKLESPTDMNGDNLEDFDLREMVDAIEDHASRLDDIEERLERRDGGEMTPQEEMEDLREKMEILSRKVDKIADALSALAKIGEIFN